MIRFMKKEDLDQVAELEAKCIQQPWSRNSFEESLEKDYSLFLVAEEEGKVCAYIGLYLSYEDAEITGIAVLPEKRRLGLGKALLEKAIELTRKGGTEKILLEVRKSNQTARAFYEKMGFWEIGLRPYFYDFPKEDAILMQLDIKK